EVRDRLDQRFRLLVGSRRGLERHQTLRHTVAWSYDHLGDAEKALLERCSVFAGGFDLQSACAVAGFDDPDDFAMLDRLDALVRKSLLVADRSSGRTRFSMLETIRQFANEQLVASAAAEETRTAHAHHFAGQEAGVLALWDSARQREAYEWFSAEFANLRTAFRWAADHRDLDTAAAIAIYATLLGFWVEQHEPISWAEELIEPAKAVNHRRLAQLYVMAAQGHVTGQIDDAVGYLDAGHAAIEGGRFDDVTEEFEGILVGGYLTKGEIERCVEIYRNTIAQKPGTHIVARASLAVALTIAGAHDEAMVACEDLLASAEATGNPHVVSWTAFSYGFVHRDADPEAAYDVFRGGLEIAQDSGNRRDESVLAIGLSMLAATHGDPTDAFHFLALAIRNLYDSGSFSLVRVPLALLAAVLDRLGHYEPAATISGFAANAFTRTGLPDINEVLAHLRSVLGSKTYESLARKGESMTTAEMVAYAYDQIDQARTELDAVST
ncbi:ATP-binding protein, partial [Mycobacterium sp.]|uniref:ATP-binding protein n=1 Tax=Mycobacterium sp. TaxID=1785 RepID=UPI003C77612C